MNKTLSIVIEKDKNHMDVKIFVDKLKISRLTRDNYTGISCHIANSTSNNVILDAQCKQENDTIYSPALIINNNMYTSSRLTVI